MRIRPLWLTTIVFQRKNTRLGFLKISGLVVCLILSSVVLFDCSGIVFAQDRTRVISLAAVVDFPQVYGPVNAVPVAESKERQPPSVESVKPKDPLIDPEQIHHEKLDFANGLFQRGFYDMALVEYQSLIAESSDYARIEEAHVGAAESLFFLKKYKDAMVEYRRVLKKFPKTSQRSIAIVRIAQSLHQINKNVLAQKVFEKIDPGVLEGDLKLTHLFYYGETLKALKKYQEARNSLERLVSVQDSGSQGWLSFLELADIEASLGNHRKAEERFDQAFEKADSDSWKSRVLYRKGKAQFEAGQYADALKTFQGLLDQFPNQPIAQRGRLSLITTLYQLAQYLEITRFYASHRDIWDFAGNDYEILKIIIKSFDLSHQPNDALSVVEESLKNPKLSLERQKDLAFIQADLLLKTKQFDKLRELTQSVAPELWTDDYRIFLRAESAYGMADYPTALAQYAELREKFPQSQWISSAVYGIAFVYQQMKNVPEAVRAFNELFNLAGDDQKKRVALYNIILVHDDAGAWADAITAAEKFLSVFSDGEYVERVRYLRGYFAFKQENYDQAIDVLQAFMDRYPESGLKNHVLFYLGFSHQSKGQLHQAFGFYGQISLNVDDPELAAAVMKNRALMYLQNKQNDEAAKEFHRMMEFVKSAKIDPDLMFWLIEYDLSRQDYRAALQTLGVIRDQLSADHLLRANYLTGEVYRQNNQCELAIPAFDSAIQSEVTTQFKGLAYLGKINCLGQMQKYKESSEALKIVLDQFHDDVFVTLRAKLEAAKLEENQGNFEQAAKLYMFVAVLYKDETVVPQALYSAGQIFEKLGKKIEAVKSYSEILQEYPSSLYFPKAQERIKVLQ